MTIEEIKKMLEALGIKTDELKDAALEKAEAWLDANGHANAPQDARLFGKRCGRHDSGRIRRWLLRRSSYGVM